MEFVGKKKNTDFPQKLILQMVLNKQYVSVFMRMLLKSNDNKQPLLKVEKKTEEKKKTVEPFEHGAIQNYSERVH